MILMSLKVDLKLVAATCVFLGLFLGFYIDNSIISKPRIEALTAQTVEQQSTIDEMTGSLSILQTSFDELEALYNEQLETKTIDPSCRGAILIGGNGLSEEALERARELQVRGIVVGGLPPELVSHVEQLPFPTIATEGIGSAPMSAPIFHLLTTNDGREASISGRVQSRRGIVRPEVIIPMPDGTVPPTQTQTGTPLRVGTRVRLVRAPYMGAAGTVVSLPIHARRIETGARVHGAEVDLGREAPVFVPLANLEVLR